MHHDVTCNGVLRPRANRDGSGLRMDLASGPPIQLLADAKQSQDGDLRGAGSQLRVVLELYKGGIRNCQAARSPNAAARRTLEPLKVPFVTVKEA